MVYFHVSCVGNIYLQCFNVTIYIKYKCQSKYNAMLESFCELVLCFSGLEPQLWFAVCNRQVGASLGARGHFILTERVTPEHINTTLCVSSHI